MNSGLLSTAEVHGAIKNIAGRRFGSFMHADRLAELARTGNVNKGLVGQVLEQVLGVGNSSRTLDLSDGELKTHKSSEYGQPLETVAVTSVMGLFDEMLAGCDFADSRVFIKLRRVLYVPAFRPRDVEPRNWMFFEPVLVDLDLPLWLETRRRLKADYDFICENSRSCVEGYGHLHGTPARGRHLQIRTKDSAPYSPIYAKSLGRYVSDKNYAFYLTTDFVSHIHELAGFDPRLSPRI